MCIIALLPGLRSSSACRLYSPCVGSARTFRMQAAAAGGAGAQRDVSSARLHLRGLLKQAVERYDERPAYGELQALLAEVEAAQARLSAAS